MKVRFLQTTASAHPEYPFRAGQVIDVPRLSPELRQAVRLGLAEVLFDHPAAAAVATESDERAALPKAKRPPVRDAHA